MAGARNLSTVFLLVACLVTGSCLKLPAEFLMPMEVKQTEADTTKGTDKILDELKALDFSNMGSTVPPSPQDCLNAFNLYIDGKFKNGFVPYRPVLALEYAPKVTTFCPTVDMVKQINQAFANRTSKKYEVDGTVINLNNIGLQLGDHECIGRIMNPKENKLVLNELEVIVKSNRLNVHSVPMEIYYSTRMLTKKALEATDAKKKFIEEGILKLFAVIDPIPGRLEGTFPARIVAQGKELEQAKEFIFPLSRQLVVFQKVEDVKMEFATMNNEIFYVVPKGSLTLSMGLVFEVVLGLDDARCALREFKEDVREVDGPRRAKYNNETPSE
jgi:hypothetical protein